MTLVAVYRTANGPAQVFLLDDPEAPPTASLPGINVTGVFYAKGPAFTWADWTQHLEDMPSAGNWALEQVPDRLTQPNQVLAFVRLRELQVNLAGQAQ